MVNLKLAFVSVRPRLVEFWITRPRLTSQNSFAKKIEAGPLDFHFWKPFWHYTPNKRGEGCRMLATNMAKIQTYPVRPEGPETDKNSVLNMPVHIHKTGVK